MILYTATATRSGLIAVAAIAIKPDGTKVARVAPSDLSAKGNPVLDDCLAKWLAGRPHTMGDSPDLMRSVTDLAESVLIAREVFR